MLLRNSFSAHSYSTGSTAEGRRDCVRRHASGIKWDNEVYIWRTKDSNSTEENKQSLRALKCLRTAVIGKSKHWKKKIKITFLFFGIARLNFALVYGKKSEKQNKSIHSLIYLLRDSHWLNHLKLASNISVAFPFSIHLFNFLKKYHSFFFGVIRYNIFLNFIHR